MCKFFINLFKEALKKQVLRRSPTPEAHLRQGIGEQAAVELP